MGQHPRSYSVCARCLSAAESGIGIITLLREAVIVVQAVRAHGDVARSHLVTIQVPHRIARPNEINKLHQPSEAGAEKTPPVHPKFSRNVEKRASWHATKLVVTH
jgi:hypothetical protein